MEGTCFLTTFGPTTISNNLGGVVVAGSTWVAEGDVTISGNSIENLPVSTEFAGGVTLLNSEWVTYGNVVISNNIGNQTAGGIGLTNGLWRSLGAVTISNNKAPQGGGNQRPFTQPIPLTPLFSNSGVYISQQGVWASQGPVSINGNSAQTGAGEFPRLSFLIPSN